MSENPKPLSRAEVRGWYVTAVENYNDALAEARRLYGPDKLFPEDAKCRLVDLKVPLATMMTDWYSRMLLSESLETVQSMLRIMIGEPDLEIDRYETQKDLVISGRSMMPDLVAFDKRSRVILLELENDLSKAVFYRWTHEINTARICLTPAGDDIPRELEICCIAVTNGIRSDLVYGTPYTESFTVRNSQAAGAEHPVSSSLLFLAAGSHLENSMDGSTRDDRFRLMEDFLQPDPSLMHFDFLFRRNAELKFGTKGERQDEQ